MTKPDHPEAACLPAFLQWPGDAARMIADADWVARGLPPIRDWPASLKATVSLMIRTTVPMVLLWGPDGVMIYNDGYTEITQGVNKMAMPVAEAWPEIAQWNLDMLAKVRAGTAETFKNMEMVLRRHGRDDTIYFNLDYSPVLDDDGTINGMLVIVVETTDEVLEERIRASEQMRQRAMLDQMPGFAAVLHGPTHVFSYVNDAYLQIGGARDYLGRPVREVFPELEGQGFFELLDGVFATGERFTAQNMPVALSNAEQTFVNLLYEPIRDDSGKIVGIFAGGYDATENYLVATRAAERESFLSGVLRSSTDCIKVLDLEGRLTFMTEGGQKVMEIDDFADVRSCPWPSFWTGEGADHAERAIAEAKAGRSYNFIAPANTYKGTPKWWDVSVSPIRDSEGNTISILSVSRDTTETIAAQERQKLLNAELGHRLKNVLTMVQAIATQTFRPGQDPAAVSSIFSDRLAAFASATNVLTAASWDGSSVLEVINAGLGSATGYRDRIEIDGDECLLDSQAALALTLAVHELTTNAIKYGALSTDAGRVAIRWSAQPRPDGAREFHFEWREHGGPPVRVPGSRGFGSRLIERSLRSFFGGEGSIRFEPEGVIFTIDGLLDREQIMDEVAA